MVPCPIVRRATMGSRPGEPKGRRLDATPFAGKLTRPPDGLERAASGAVRPLGCPALGLAVLHAVPECTPALRADAGQVLDKSCTNDRLENSLFLRKQQGFGTLRTLSLASAGVASVAAFRTSIPTAASSASESISVDFARSGFRRRGATSGYVRSRKDIFRSRRATREDESNTATIRNFALAAIRRSSSGWSI